MSTPAARHNNPRSGLPSITTPHSPRHPRLPFPPARGHAPTTPQKGPRRMKTIPFQPHRPLDPHPHPEPHPHFTRPHPTQRRRVRSTPTGRAATPPSRRLRPMVPKSGSRHHPLLPPAHGSPGGSVEARPFPAYRSLKQPRPALGEACILRSRGRPAPPTPPMRHP